MRKKKTTASAVQIPERVATPSQITLAATPSEPKKATDTNVFCNESLSKDMLDLVVEMHNDTPSVKEIPELLTSSCI